MKSIRDLIKEFYMLPLGHVTEGNDRAVKILGRHLPFKVHSFPSGAELNGWTVPQRWAVRKALIRRDGKLVYDGTKHPLGVISYSQSFTGRLSADELKQHLYFHHDLEDAIPYHDRFFYQNWKKEWGFCVPRRLVEHLASGDYDVELMTEFAPGTMKVLECHLEGARPETICFNAHLCHAGQANDDASGVAVGIALFAGLLGKPLEYSYRLVIGPEFIGTTFYMDSLAKEDLARLRHAVFLECLGNDQPLALQQSFTGTAAIDRIAAHVLTRRGLAHTIGAFRTVIGNDEIVWESPGYEIPAISLSRGGFPEYHSDHDSIDIVYEERLQEAVKVLADMVSIFEGNAVMIRKFSGLICLSNPKYDLYIDPGQEYLGNIGTRERKEWNQLMNFLPRYCDGTMTVLQAAERHELPFWDVLDYVRRFEAKGLVQLDRTIE